jgi:hypothetical protein
MPITGMQHVIYLGEAKGFEAVACRCHPGKFAGPGRRTEIGNVQ